MTSTVVLGWVAIVAYFAVTLSLALRGARRSGSLAGYAVGGRQLPPAVVGLSLAAQLTSVATFVINPGLVHAYGLAALLGYGVSAALGITLGLALLSPPFRAHGVRVAALTLPQWIGVRYESPALRRLFVLLSLGLLAFATLIVVGLSLVVGKLLALPPEPVAIALLALAVSGVALGGATGSAWTNAVQASIMVVVALLMIGKGLPLLAAEPGVLARLAAIDPPLAQPINPASPLFRTVFETYFANFLVGFAIVCQPHILGRALFLKEARDLSRYLATAIACGLTFTAVLVCGLWARLTLAAPVAIDRVIPTWIAESFSPPLQVVLSIGLLCAGLSTLEGISLAVSAIFSIDLFPLVAKGGDERRALRFGKLGLLAFAAVTALLALWQLSHPTAGTVAIFAQYGIYLLFTGAFLPLACGMFVPRAGRGLVTLGVVVSVAAYLATALTRWTVYANNPAILATTGILAGWAVVGLGLLIARRPANARSAQA